MILGGEVTRRDLGRRGDLGQKWPGHKEPESGQRTPRRQNAAGRTDGRTGRSGRGERFRLHVAWGATSNGSRFLSHDVQPVDPRLFN